MTFVEGKWFKETVTTIPASYCNKLPLCFCLFVFIFYVPVNYFSVILGQFSICVG